MIVQIKTLINVSNGKITLHYDKTSKTSIIFSLDEKQHYEEHGFVLRKYSKRSSLYWFFTDIDYNQNLRILSTMISSQRVRRIIDKFKRQIFIDVILNNELKDSEL